MEDSEVGECLVKDKMARGRRDRICDGTLPKFFDTARATEADGHRIGVLAHCVPGGTVVKGGSLSRSAQSPV